jgi:Ni/Co efflux regulator RcnB
MRIQKPHLVAFFITAIVAGNAAIADKPDSPGNSGKQKSAQGAVPGSSTSYKSEYGHGYFNNDRIARISSYYSQHGRSGKCPPGLAKKNNGCQPPGQAKKWRRGEPLPPGVLYFDLPSALLAELGRTPEGQKVIRAGTDLLLISIATGMVLDALEIPSDAY